MSIMRRMVTWLVGEELPHEGMKYKVNPVASRRVHCDDCYNKATLMVKQRDHDTPKFFCELHFERWIK